MSLRFNAIENLSTSGEPKKVEVSAKITNIFGSHVFTLKQPGNT
jgi:vacuolar-type H+-ATPase subunit D/Vma8